MLPKSSWTTFKLIFENLSALGGCRVTIIGGVFDFRGFLRISRRPFLYFFVKSFSIARSDLVVIKTEILWVLYLPWKRGTMSRFLPVLDKSF